MTTVKWILVLLGIVAILGLAWGIDNHFKVKSEQKRIDAEVEKRTAEISKTYDDQKTVLEGQVTNKQNEIANKNILLKEKDKKLKESEAKVTSLQLDKARLEKLLASILLPVNVEETKKRLQDLGVVLCK